MPFTPGRAFRGIAPLLLAGLLAPSLHARAEKPAPPEAAAPTQKEKGLPPIFDPDVVGAKAIEAASKICAETNRRPFVVFGTNDCGPCRTLNDALFDPLFFQAFIVQFVPILIDVSPGGPNTELLKNIGIDPKKGFPAVCVFELSQVPPEVTRNGEMVAVAKKGVKAVQDWILARYRTELPPAEPAKK